MPTTSLIRALATTKLLAPTRIAFYSAKSGAPTYEHKKAVDVSPEPVVAPSGAKTYVVSEPDPKGSQYDVPSGAYAATSPYQPQEPTSAPDPPTSSTSATPAHPTTTKFTPQNTTGIGSSSAVRFRSAAGRMAQAADGGLGIMDDGTTTNMEQEGLGKRNPQPLGESEGKQGLNEAWKHRK